jgi:hypothetical protein
MSYLSKLKSVHLNIDGDPNPNPNPFSAAPATTAAVASTSAGALAPVLSSSPVPIPVPVPVSAVPSSMDIAAMINSAVLAAMGPILAANNKSNNNNNKVAPVPATPVHVVGNMNNANANDFNASVVPTFPPSSSRIRASPQQNQSTILRPSSRQLAFIPPVVVPPASAAPASTSSSFFPTSNVLGNIAAGVVQFKINIKIKIKININIKGHFLLLLL